MNVNSPSDAELIVQKIPCDIGIHRNPRKGTLNGAEKILEDYEFSRNTLVDEVFTDEFSLENTHRRIEDNTNNLLNCFKPLISLGGDHSVSYPVIMALKRRNPGMKLVWLDAHLDLKEKIGNHVSHDVVIRELLLRNGFSEDEIYFIGITEVDHDEEEFLEDRDLNIFMSNELEEFKREFDSSEQPVYLSIDIDALKKEVAPGTGYPDGKLKTKQVQEIIKNINPQYADIVEVAPSLDKKQKTVKASRKILSTLEKQIKPSKNNDLKEIKE